jgi:hypothetical protein
MEVLSDIKIRRGSWASVVAYCSWSTSSNGIGSTTFAPACSINRYYDPSTDQFLSVDPDVQVTDQPYAFVNDNPLNAEDPLGLKGGPGSMCLSLKNSVCNAQVAQEVKQIKATVGGINLGDAVKVAEVLGAVACVAATDGGCAVLLGASSFAAGTVSNAISHKGNVTSSAFLREELGVTAEAAVLSIPDSAAEGLVQSFSDSGPALTSGQRIFVKAHAAVIKSFCALFCP